ncbi:hypothetical protein [Sulfurovum sp.]|uniref:hypothetical protein n=1 Tax=Sulfurovum sp. TaxID=1969726 RepID=UPI0025F31669|nr:hypothetical protein [Sulfurovum sp.]
MDVKESESVVTDTNTQKPKGVIMDKKELEVLESGNMTVVVAGAAAVALSIIGLAGILPIVLVSAAAIAIGVSLVLAGIAVAAEKKKILASTQGGRYTSSGMFTVGIGLETIAGVASIVLGILSLLKMDPAVLLGADVIVLGMAFLAMSATDARENANKLNAPELTKAHRISYESAKVAIDIQILVGISTITLGILSIIGIAPVTLLLVAFLAGGASLAIKGTTLGVRLYEERND